MHCERFLWMRGRGPFCDGGGIDAKTSAFNGVVNRRDLGFDQEYHC